MVNIDKYYNKIIENIDQTKGKYKKGFKAGFVQGIDFLPFGVEIVKDLVTNFPPNKYKNNPITLGYKTWENVKEYENKLLNQPDEFLSMGMGHAIGSVCGIFGLWYAMGALDTANYIQRRGKE
ncbi:MAG: hypothetical protein KAT28_00845 [Candidatus Aenigmarchaeota archaeon]|nr:hypothetical protein [Candidatus Aenigmarchaeota archaeon]